MNTLPMFFLLLAKRQTRRASFFLLPLAAACFCLLFTRLALTEPDGARVGLYAAPGDETAAAVCRSLLREDALPYRFYAAASPEALSDDVAAGRAACGFLLPEGLLEAADAGNARRAITVLAPPDALLQEAAAETVYAAWFQEYALHVALQELEAQAGVPSGGETSPDAEAETQLPGALPETPAGAEAPPPAALPEAAAGAREAPAALRAEASRYYHALLQSGGVFSFTYETPDGQPAPLRQSPVREGISPAFSAAALRRLLLLFLFLSCFAGGFSVYHDRDCGFYQVLPGRRALWARCASLLLPLLPCALALFLCGRFLFFISLTREILTVSACSFLLCLAATFLLRTKRLYASLLPPLLLLGSLLLLV